MANCHCTFNFLFNIENYSHYLKSITFVGTRSLQECAGITVALIFSRIIFKIKTSYLKMMVVVVIVSRLSMTLSSQFFRNFRLNTT